MCHVHLGELKLEVLDYIVTISIRYILYCVCFNLYCGYFNLFCNVWVCVCVGFVMCGCFGNIRSSEYKHVCACIHCYLYCLYFVFCIVSFMYIYSYLFCLY